MSLGYALYVSTVCTIFDWFGYGMFNLGLNEPVVCGALVGLLLGDVKTGIVIGGTLQLIYLGVIGVGAAIPVNKTTATTIAVALTIVSKTDMNTAIALAVPVAVMGQLSNMLAWTLNTSLMHMADKYAEKAEYAKMNRLTYVGSLIFFICKFIPIFLCIFYGSPFVAALNENMPAWISNWLKASTGMLPALGFGMLFSMMYKPKYVPYFIIGFVMCAVFGGSLLSIALLGIAAAVINYYQNNVAAPKRRGAM
ncbi:MAG: PTS sugar transporter subunit IIC [Erysipelotrichia bacterium]|nr:PTS sugar transporter subunit IIC [Erysipelotrichia bacterium]